MNDLEKVSVLKGALEQLISEVQHLLGRFKAQVSLENEQTDLDPARIKQRHQIVYESVETEWEVIRTLYLLLISNTRDGVNTDPQETLQPIENLLEKLKEGQNPFKYHEFQFPFHLSSLVSGIKSIVRNHIMHIAPKEVDNCDLFSNASPTKSPKNPVVESVSNPIVTNNVRQAAKKFEAITETIAESASKLRKAPTKRFPVSRNPKVIVYNQSANTPDENPHQNVFDAMLNEINSSKPSVVAEGNGVLLKKELSEACPPGPEQPQVQNETIVDVITNRPQQPQTTIENTVMDHVVNIDKGVISSSDRLEMGLLPPLDMGSETISRTSSKKIAISDKSIAFLPSSRNNSQRGFQSSKIANDGVQRSNTFTKPTNQAVQVENEVIENQSSTRTSVIESNTTSPAPVSSTTPPNQEGEESLLPPRSRTPVTDYESDNPFRSSTASKKGPEQPVVHVSAADQSPSMQKSPASKFRNNISPKKEIAVFVPKTDAYASTIQNLSSVKATSVKNAPPVLKPKVTGESVKEIASANAPIFVPKSKEMEVVQMPETTVEIPFNPSHQTRAIIPEPSEIFDFYDNDDIERVPQDRKASTQSTHTIAKVYIDEQSELRESRANSNSSIRTITKQVPNEVEESTSASVANVTDETNQIGTIEQIPQASNIAKSYPEQISKPQPLTISMNVSNSNVIHSPSMVSMASVTSSISPAPPVNKSTKPNRKPSQIPTPSSTNPAQQMMELKRMTLQVAKRRNDIASVMISEKDYILGLMTAFSEEQENELRQDTDSIETRAVTVPLEQPIQKNDIKTEMDAIFENFASSKTTGPNQDNMMTPLPKPKNDLNTPINEHVALSSFDESTKRASSHSQVVKPVKVQERPKENVKETQTFHMQSKVFDPTSSAAAYIDDKDQQTITAARLMHLNIRSKHLQLLMIPLNGMFDMRLLELSQPHRFGRNNTSNHPCFKAFGTLVVSRNHVDIFAKDGKVFIKDIGSNSGTFRNNARLSQPSQVSIDVELHTGDYIQFGKDFTQGEDLLDEYGRIQARKRCVKFQIAVIQPGQTPLEAIQGQSIPIEKPVNRSDIPNSNRSDTDSNFQEEKLDEKLKLASESFNRDSGAQQSISDESSKPSVLEKPLPELPKDIKRTMTVSEEKVPRIAIPQPSSAISPAIITPEGHDKKPSEERIVSPKPYLSPKVSAKEKQHFVIAYTLSGSKISKFMLTGLTGSTILEVNMKKWDEKCRFTVQDHKSMNDSFDVFLETKPGAKSPTKIKGFNQLPWQVSTTAGKSLGHLSFASDMKLELHPVDKQTDSSIALTGDFKEQRFICVRKSAQTREQTLLGEAKGRYQSKKTLRETSYLINLDISDTNPLLLAGVLLTVVLYGN